MTAIGHPERNEASPYYFTYIDKVPAGDIRDILDTQEVEFLSLLRDIPDDRSRTRYAPDKWNIREVVSHVNDAERLFVFRAFWFARGFDSPLPSFDQATSIAHARADERSWMSHVEEFASVRAATRTFFRGLPGEAWTRRGVASDNPFSVRALAYIAAGHVAHHAAILRSRYLPL